VFKKKWTYLCWSA